MPTALRLGTRGSLLARTQSQTIADAIMRANPDITVELVLIKTTGDRVQDRPLADLGGKGLFTKEIEVALLRNEIDLAVHSYKDVPITMPLVDVHDLVIAATPRREDARDVLIARRGERSIDDLPKDAHVGTGSLRRRCQLLERRPDLRIEPLRGNIDTRLRKLAAGDFDAIVLAMAGLKRVRLFDAQTMSPLPMDQMTSAPGQGALAIQARRGDERVADAITPLNDPETADCVALERQIVQLLQGDCHSPIAAHATLHGDLFALLTAVGTHDGGLPVKRAVVNGPRADLNRLAPEAVVLLGR